MLNHHDYVAFCDFILLIIDLENYSTYHFQINTKGAPWMSVQYYTNVIIMTRHDESPKKLISGYNDSIM